MALVCWHVKVFRQFLIFRPLARPAKSEEEVAKKVDEGGFLVCGKFWLPSLGQIFVWKVLANPLFLLLTFSVVTGRTAMRAFGMLVPAFGESLGLGKETSTYLLTIMAVADFISRFKVHQVKTEKTESSGSSPPWQLPSSCQE